jgi:hypothetical protein
MADKMRAMKCKCPTDSPFRWRERIGQSAISDDAMDIYRRQNGVTMAVDRARAKGVEPGRIYGISNKSDANIQIFAANVESLVTFPTRS